MEVLVVASHPDDEVLGCGGTIGRHIAHGDSVFVCIVAEGGTVSYSENLSKVLKESAGRSSNILGVEEVISLDFPEQKLECIPIIDITQSLERVMAKIRPQVLYTHHRGDLNRDHRVVFEATMVAARPLVESPIRRILSYEIPSSTGWMGAFMEDAFMPNVYVNVEATFGKKLEALQQYKTEMRDYPHPRSKEALEIIARHRGIESGLELAEAFMLVREIF